MKFAVIGCGNIASRHLAVIDNDPRAELVALCDVEAGKCQRSSKLYGDIPYFTDYSELLKNIDVDIVNICTPHGLHAGMAVEAARQGVHVLVEKPMALNESDAQIMIKTAKENGTRLMVVKQNRYNVPIALTKHALEEGRLGKIFMCQVDVLWNRNNDYYSNSNWRGKKNLEGGSLYTQVSHFIDLMIWWFGDMAETSAVISTMNHQIEIEDCGTANLRFESGVLGTLAWTTCVYNKNYEGSMTIIGEKGTIKIGGKYLNTIEYWDVQSYPLKDDVSFTDKPNAYGGKYQGTSSNHDQVINNVISDLLYERHNVVEGDEGIKTIRAIEKIYDNAVWMPCN